ncbi:type II secretion protein [Salinigranum rubrum]|uniref:Type II secretion protein n=1 Tax=Salinigranum rubrum TaxID=755307 RepID=A0A2I8VGG7_9EURY|nr:ATPase, T2SS/T4P/T4SS family [Salinigranum rubrum]AUV81018.1 type II secretion protein [Salinigranum rubrum]
MTLLTALVDRSRALLGTESEVACSCDVSFETPAGTHTTPDTELRVDADNCPGEGDLTSSPDCRATVIGALTERDADVVRIRAGGVVRTYVDDACAFLVAAGRFAERAAHHDERLAARALYDPLGAAHEATGRAGPVARLAAETGLALGAERVAAEDGYGSVLRAFVAPTVARCRVDVDPPVGATLRDAWDLDTGARVRLYDATDGRRRYHLLPAWHSLDGATLETLGAARRLLATGAVSGGPRAPHRAARRVADDADPVDELGALLARYTRGHGVLDDLFSDSRVTDVFVTSPVDENPVRVVVDGARLATNVHLSPEGAAALASRFRRASGRAFSRATPTLDATVDTQTDRRIRLAGVAPPASDGLGFAFRAHDETAWTLARLVSLGTLPASAAGLLSVAVERGAATLVAGPRGAGKTTTLGALLWELPTTTRAVVVEDTPELPVAALREQDRDVQSIRTGLDDGAALSPDEALRAALRLGDGALAVGEVRGEEAQVLYEAMRVGAADGAVLGTVHGVGGDGVKARMVTDLSVSERAFGATDLVVTLTAEAGRRVTRVEEVRTTDERVHFATLFDIEDGDDRLRSTGVLDRGESVLLSALALPGESYADVRARVSERGEAIACHAEAGLTAPEERGY